MSTCVQKLRMTRIKTAVVQVQRLLPRPQAIEELVLCSVQPRHRVRSGEARGKLLLALWWSQATSRSAWSGFDRLAGRDGVSSGDVGLPGNRHSADVYCGVCWSSAEGRRHRGTRDWVAHLRQSVTPNEIGSLNRPHPFVNQASFACSFLTFSCPSFHVSLFTLSVLLACNRKFNTQEIFVNSTIPTTASKSANTPSTANCPTLGGQSIRRAHWESRARTVLCSTGLRRKSAHCIAAMSTVGGA